MGLSHDIVVHHIDLSAVPIDILSLTNFLVPNGVILLTVSGMLLYDLLCFVC